MNGHFGKLLHWTFGGLMMSCVVTSCSDVVPKDELVINLKEKGAEVAPSMYGVFFEEINHAGDGGLYAELVNNRSFEELEMPEGYYAEGNTLYPKQVVNHISGRVNRGHHYRWTTDPVPGWMLDVKDSTVAKMSLSKEHPKFATAPNNLKLEIADASSPVRLVNKGYWGMNLVQDDTYLLRAIFKVSPGYNGEVKVVLLSEDNEVIASAPLEIKGKAAWNDVTLKLQPSATDGHGRLALEFDDKGTVWVDYVSLFPEKTFNNRPNGLRKDVADMLVGLQPAFVRWPGGCVVEGITLENRFEWKKTLGDPAARPGEYSTWGYRCSYGFGYYELLQFCEDIGADAMFVCNVGLGCQARMSDACPDDEIEYYVDDCMDAIEYAIGDVTTEWGALRAKAGHPEPFPLKYVEIGNENWGREYDKRFDIFYKAIKAKYPQLILISNHGANGTGSIEKTDMIDPHWYVAPEFFFQNTTIFDDHVRGKYDVYVGEYACNSQVGGGNMRAALSEAAFIGGMERNGDLVKMTSYAPLLENRHDRNWPVNLIWLDTDSVLGRSSYYVQKIAAENRPTYNLKTNITMSAAEAEPFEEGRLGFGSYDTQVEFKDVTITSDDGIEVPIDLAECIDQHGEWRFADGVLKQTSMVRPSRYMVADFVSDNYVLECKVRKNSGSEGFFLYWGMNEHNDGYVFNVAGWANETSAVEGMRHGRTTGVVGNHRVAHSIETDKWYDVKVVITPKQADLYIDGSLLLSCSPEATPQQFYATGYDEQTGDVIVKVVNSASKPYPLAIRLDGAESVKSIGKVITLAAASDEDENSFAEPQKIYPLEAEYTGFSDNFTYTFQPFSYTVLRIRAK